MSGWVKLLWLCVRFLWADLEIVNSGHTSNGRLLELLGKEVRPDRQAFLSELAECLPFENLCVLLWLYDPEKDCLILDRLFDSTDPSMGMPSDIAGANCPGTHLESCERAVMGWANELEIRLHTTIPIGDPGDGNSYLGKIEIYLSCLLYTSPSPRDKRQSRMPSSA